MNGYPNRNCNRQYSVGITSKLLARYPGNLFLGAYVEKMFTAVPWGPLCIGNGICIGMHFMFLGAYVEKMLLLFCGVPYASGTEFVLECSLCNDLLG